MGCVTFGECNSRVYGNFLVLVSQLFWKSESTFKMKMLKESLDTDETRGK